MVRGRQAGVVRDFQSTPTVQQKLGTVGGADSSRASGAPTPYIHKHTNKKIPTAKTHACTQSGAVHVCGGGGGYREEGEAQRWGQIRKERKGEDEDTKMEKKRRG